VIESIYQIGKAVMEGSSGKRAFLESLAKEAPKPKKGNPSIAILKLNTEDSSLAVELREIKEQGSNTVEDFLWLGNAASSASNQDRLTTDNLSYLVSQTIPNLLSVVTVDTPFYKTLQTLVDNFFVDVGEVDVLGVIDNATTYRRSRQLLNLVNFAQPLEKVH
jgi:CRISPR-associated protein Csh1